MEWEKLLAAQKFSMTILEVKDLSSGWLPVGPAVFVTQNLDQTFVGGYTKLYPSEGSSLVGIKVLRRVLRFG